MMEEINTNRNTISDNSIISNVLAGNKNMFEIIIRRYNQRLYRIGMSILQQDTAVEDAMQNTYISAYQHLKQFEHRSSFGTWITRIMLNECLTQQSKKKPVLVEDFSKEHIQHTMNTPDRLLANKELQALILHAIEQLPEKYRLVFILREVERFSIKETSDLLQIEESNVKVRLNRAKTMLQGELKDYMQDQVYVYHLSRCDKMVEDVFRRLEEVSPPTV